jgi:predicted porin
MKKSLIALAVLAASGASFAQSSVTLYGIADLWLGQSEAMGVNSVKQTKIDSGGVSTSRFGFKGTEDLGGGLKANFTLEQGFNIDSGAQGTPGLAFNRYAYVGFSGGFGEVKLGKTGTAYDDIWGSGNASFDSALSANNEVLKSGNYNWNPANSIYYSTPTMSGFSGAASYTLGENKSAAVDAGAIYSAHVKYEAGPVAAALAYQVEKLDMTAVSKVEFTRLTGSYNFGVAKAIVGFGQVKDSTLTTNEWEIGADFPVSSALTISGGIARSTDNDAADTTRQGYSLAANYSLSKRTSVYGGYRAATTKANGAADQDGSLLAVGVRHAF